jgi:hypothetical protein
MAKSSWCAYARFIREGRYLLRTRTELRYGERATRLIGAVVMVNPGSSMPVEGMGAMLPATLDPTMRTVIRVIESAYSMVDKKLMRGDYIRICNLFDLCAAQLEQAISSLREIHEENNQLGKTTHTSLRDIPRDVPWIWLAWGIDTRLSEERNEVQGLLNDKLIVGAKADGVVGGYYHPLYLQRARLRRPHLERGVMEQISERIPD